MHFKNPDKIRDYITRIPSHLHRLDYDAIKIDCNSYFTSLPISIVDFTNDKFFFYQLDRGGINVIYRARIITNENNKPHDTVSEISYIPTDKIDKTKKFGRVNKPYESMFYGSLNIPTACCEATTKGNVFEKTNSVFLTVGIWKFETPLKLVQMPHSEKYFKQFYDEVNIKSEKIQLEDIKDNNKEIRGQFEQDIDYEVLQFFADEFAKYNTNNDYEYMLSNYYADRVFNRIPAFLIDEDIDGIIYPSIALSYQEKNIVLKPEVVDKKLKFISAMQIWFVRNPNSGGGAQFIPIKQNVKADADGNLLWNHKN